MGTSFDQLIDKVDQAENALEAQERRVPPDWPPLRASWRAGWTPGRIVIAGLAAGFMVGRVEPGKSVAKGSSIMQMITALSGLFASATAQQAASQVDDVADDVGQVADTVQAAAPAAVVVPVDPA